MEERRSKKEIAVECAEHAGALMYDWPDVDTPQITYTYAVTFTAMVFADADKETWEELMKNIFDNAKEITERASGRDE